MTMLEGESSSRTLRHAPGAAGRWRPRFGAWPEQGGVRFRVWAPEAQSVAVAIDGREAVHPLERQGDGTFSGLVEGVGAGTRYRYKMNDEPEFYPDPATRFQPEGVDGPSEVVDPRGFGWTDAGWKGLRGEDAVIYELHVGTFSPEGTFAGAAERLERLRDLGVTAVELMPLADFAGERNWGYDGVALYAPSRVYGTPDDLRRLVDRAHGLGLAVILDVVYNHFGPAGNYALAFSRHYLTDRHKSPWGASVNLDGPGADMVREFFIDNAQHWIHEYRCDGLRLDATHALIDESERHFVAELAGRVRASVGGGRSIVIIAEDHRNLAEMLQPAEAGGWGLDGVWADDFHHQARRLLAGDSVGYYEDYAGTAADLAATINQGWFYTGQHSPHMGEARGTDPSGIDPHRFVFCLQNHDQIGNRALGERLHHQIDPASFRAATALLLALPRTPLLFMGQEWGASAPFLYFTDHDAELGRLITEGRRQEFGKFEGFSDPAMRELIPDPQEASTFDRSRLDWSEPDREPHASLLRLHQALLALRRFEPALRPLPTTRFEATAPDPDSLVVRTEADGSAFLLVARFRGEGPVALPPDARYEPVLHTEHPEFAPDPSPIRFESDHVTFARPGAMLVRVVG